MKKRLDKIAVGFVMAVLAVAIGFLIAMLWYKGQSPTGQLGGFFSLFTNSPDFQGDILMFSIAPLPFLFYLLNRKDMPRAANGMVIFALIYAIYIVAIKIL